MRHDTQYSPATQETLHTIIAVIDMKNPLSVQNTIRADFMTEVKKTFGSFERSSYTVKTSKAKITLTYIGYIFDEEK